MTIAGSRRTRQRSHRIGFNRVGFVVVGGLVAGSLTSTTPASATPASARPASAATASAGLLAGAAAVPHDDSLAGIDLPTDAPDMWHPDRLASAITVEIVDAAEADPESARHVVEALGGEIVDTAPSGVMLARVPAITVGELVADLGGRVRRPVHLDVRPERSNPEMFGPTSGSEVAITNADDWQAAGFTGAGVKVGVIDFFDVTAYWNLGEMGPAPIANVTAFCLAEGADCSDEFFDGTVAPGDDHGPAVVEIVKDMAPGAEIYIGRASTETDYYTLVGWFADQGVRVISRSLGSRYDGPGDGRGALDGVADHAVDRGITWINSGGNNAFNRYYRSPVRLIGNSVAFGAAGSDTWLRFNGCIAPGGVRWVNDWDVPPAQRTDYDVFIHHSPIGNPSTTEVVHASATADQTGGAPPLEIIQGSACPAPGNAFYMRIEHVSGDPTGDVIEILDYGDGMANYVQAQFSAATSIVDSRNAGVIAVGAIDPPDSGTLGNYSSQGPTNDGRIKPDLTAPSGFHSTTFGSEFRGTSASAPVVAGGAALLLGANLAVGARELGDLVRNTVIERGPSGPDNFYGTGEFRLPAPPVTPVSSQPSTYVPLASPTRILDTRPSGPIGPSNLVGTLWPGEILEVPITGVAGIPADATAVAINLTLVGAARTGYGQALPTLAAPVGAFSSFNLDAAPQTRPNFAIVPLGQGGSISVYSNTGGNAIIDVLGYFTAAVGGASTEGRFVGLDTSQRVLDTRRDGNRQPLATGGTIDFGLPVGVPADQIKALVVNITGTATIGEGFVQAYPGGNSGDIYKTSTINLTAGSTAANTVIVPITPTGVSVFADLGQGGSAHVIADVTGYITSTGATLLSTGLFMPVSPARAYDSRNVAPTIDDGAQLVVSANSAPGVSVPAGASGVVWNFTATGTTRYGFLKAWATGSAEPPTSALNWPTSGMTVANAGIVRPDGAAQVTLSPTDEDGATNGPLTHLMADVFGYFT